MTHVDTELELERRRWRAEVVDKVLRVTGVALTLGTLAAGFFLTGWTPIAIFLLVVGACVGVLAFLPIGGPSFRATALLGLVTVGASSGLVRYGMTPNSLTAFAMVIVMATLLGGRRTGFAALTGLVGILATIGALHSSGWLPLDPEWKAYLDASDPKVVLRVILYFGVGSVMVIWAASELLSRSEAVARDRSNALAALEAEQATRARVQAELAAREHEFQRAQQVEVVARLAATVGHDFNNALTVMLAVIEELEAEPLRPELVEAVKDLRLATDQAASITQQLRLFGGGTPVPTTRDPVSLGAIIRKTGQALGRVLPNSVTLSVEVVDDPSVVVDEHELVRVLTNLSLNARDAMPEGGSLRFVVRPGADRQVVIEVVDTGSGMTDEVKARLFETSFTTKGERGSGLGLQSVKKSVEGLGGRLSIESEVGRGTRVCLVLPVTPRAA